MNGLFLQEQIARRPRQESNLDARKGPALKAGALPLCDGGTELLIKGLVLKFTITTLIIFSTTVFLSQSGGRVRREFDM